MTPEHHHREMEISVEDISFEEVPLEVTVVASDAVVLLPVGYIAKMDSSQYHSAALSFYKFARSEMPVKFATDPESVFEQRSGDWFAPAMLLTDQLMTQHPNIVAIACGVISNYVYTLFTGAKKPDVHVDLIVEKTRTQRFVKVTYKGNVDGLRSIEGAVQKALEDTSDGQ